MGAGSKVAAEGHATRAGMTRSRMGLSGAISI